MSPISRFCLAAAIAVGLAGCSVEADQGGAEVAADPHQWLEEVTGEEALDWVRAQNAVAEAELAATPEFQQLEAELLAIYDSDDRIPAVSKMGDYYYNFWRDKDNERGIWRRTSLEEYRKDSPEWELLLDLDALNAEEGENWVWHGANCLRPDYDRCLIALSRGGADADVTREFDLASKTWVEGGFFRAEAKGGLTWIDRDTVFVFTDFGDGTMTESGYPRIVKEWKRGTPMESAEVVYEGQADDMYISAGRDHTPGFEREFVSRTIAFYNDEIYLRGEDGSLTQVDAPNSAVKSVQREWLGLELREPWEVDGRTYPAGSLLAANFDDYMAGGREFDVLFE
ncbi:MAG: S9 family peptidase, partial [Luteimonas sp.]